MEEEETVPILSRKDVRRQKLMEYLTAKGKLKLSNSTNVTNGDNSQVKKPVTSALKVITGKENSAPVDSLRYEATKILPPRSTQQPARKTFNVTNKVNVNTLTAQQKANSVPAQLKLNQNRVLTNTYNVTSKSNLYAVSHLKKQPKTGLQSSVKTSSNAARTAFTKPNSRFSGSSNATRSGPVNAVNFRMNLGPIVKTKTGLVPAVIQPRNTNPNLTRLTSTTAANTAVSTNTSNTAKKVRSNTLSSLSVPRSSSVAPRKTFSSTALNKPVHEKTTISQRARAAIKTQDQKKSNSKPVLGKQFQPSSKTQILSGVKSMSTSTKGRAASVKPEVKVGVAKMKESACQPTARSTNQRSQAAGGEKNVQTCKAAPRIPTVPASRHSVRVTGEATRAAAAVPAGKPKISKTTESKKGSSSIKAPPPPKGTKRISAPVLSQTVPRPARTISYCGKDTDLKRPKVPVTVVPQTEVKKRTAAQKERMSKLQVWRESKGISYKRPPMTVKPQVNSTVSLPQPFWATMTEEDEAHSLVYTVDRSLADCLKLLEEGCPPDQVKGVLSRLPPLSHKFAKYWICQVRLMELEGDLEVLPMFEEAVRVVLEPVDELRTVVFEILKKKDEIQASEEKEREEDEILETVEITPDMMTPSKPVRALICREKGDSSVVKFKITATPGGPADKQSEPARINGQELRFFTPVRRSVRIERASLRLPAALQDHDVCVASYNDLIDEETKEGSEEQEDGEISPSANQTPMYVYRQNEALKDKVLVKLFYEEDDEEVLNSSSPVCN
ncbi:cytoskeleton-associated protein 2-like [Scomber scombrus]|uniref:cytoskeleton-associated protein 2-like n=1 Tax=Scomber scombrus TaxID=13677 RepID=UPI002DD92FD2|nr:cytoskeleton-associated protein 2-like [Scomber scombrus]